MTVTAGTVGLAVLLGGCSGTNAAFHPAVSVTASTATPADFVEIRGEDLPALQTAALPLEPGSPARVAALAIGVGETIAALGGGDRVVARDEASDTPVMAAAPIVTKAHAVSVERVLDTRPDLAIVDASTSPPEAIDQLRAAGVRVVEVPQAWSMAAMPDRVRAVGRAIGASRAAIDGVIARSTAQTAAGARTGSASASPSMRPAVAFLYLRGSSAIYLLGGAGSGADDLIARAGGLDAGAAAGLGPFTPLTAEALAAANPDVILVMTDGLASVGGLDGLLALPGVAQTRAGQDGRVIAVDDTVLLSFGPRTPALVDALAAGLAQVAAG